MRSGKTSSARTESSVPSAGMRCASRRGLGSRIDSCGPEHLEEQEGQELQEDDGSTLRRCC